ncbi:unnamed protein product [Diplocarpon coronariae]
MRHHDCRPSALCHTLSPHEEAVLLPHVEIPIVPISSAMDSSPNQVRQVFCGFCTLHHLHSEGEKSFVHESGAPSTSARDEKSPSRAGAGEARWGGRPQRALGRGLPVVMQFESCGRADAAEYSYHSPQLCVMASIRFPAPAAGAVVAQIMFLHGHRLTREALHRRQTELRGSRDALAGDAEVNAAGPLPSALRRCRRGVDVRRHADGARGGATRTLLHTVSTAGKQTELSLGVRLGHPESRELPWSRAPTIEL